MKSHLEIKFMKSMRDRIALLLFCLIAILLCIVGSNYADDMVEYQDHRFWSHRFVLEFSHLPLKDGEVVQHFRTAYDGLKTVIVEFDDFTPQDTAVLTATITDKSGKEYFRYECPTYAFGEKEPFYLVAELEEPLVNNKMYEIHLSLDGPGSDITVRYIPKKETHRSLKQLTSAGEKVEDGVLYISQEYYSKSSYAVYWFFIMGATLLVLLVLWLVPGEIPAKIWEVLSVPILTAIAYYSIQNLDGNLGTVETKYLIINLLLIGSIFLMIKGVLPRSGLYLSTFLFTLVATVNFYVMQFRGSELLLSDIKAFSTAMSVSKNYNFTVPPKLLTTFLFATCLVILQCSASSHKKPGKGKRTWIGRGAVFAAGVVLFLLIGNSKDIRNFQLFTISNSFSKEGYVYSNLCIWKLSRVEKPFGYSASQIGEIVSAIEDSDIPAGSVTPKNLIVIMNESLSDLGMLGDLQTNKDYMTFIHGLDQNTVKGRLYVDTFGGSTSVTEYEFLTGNTVKFFPIGSNPYASMCRSEEKGMVSILKAQGYKAVAMHPYGASNWNRDKIYPAYGFDEFIDEKGYEGAELIRNYVSDKADFDKIIEYVENTDPDQKLFIFNVTMQNHGGYDVNNGVLDKTIKITNLDEDYPIAENYLSLVDHSDSAFEYLVEHFQNCEDPTMIVMFGDHLPQLSESFYAALYGHVKAENTPEENNRMYTTPYVIWTNYDSDFEEPEEISANYLGSFVLQCAGLELTDYNRFLLQMRKKVPAIGMCGVRSADGSFIAYKDLDSSVFKDYKMLQYLRVQDRDPKLTSIFDVNKEME